MQYDGMAISLRTNEKGTSISKMLGSGTPH